MKKQLPAGLALPSLTCVNKGNRPLAAYPMTVGVPLLPGALKDGEAVRLNVGGKASLPVQGRTLQRHADGSPAWLLLDFELPLPANGSCPVRLERGAAAVKDGLKVSQDSRGLTVRGPHYTIRLSKETFSLFESWKSGGKELAGPGGDILIEDVNGKRFYGSDAVGLALELKESGPLRVVVEATGRHTAGDGSELLSFRVRYTFRRADPCVKLSYKFINREMPELGVTASLVRLTLPTSVGRRSVRHIRQTNTGANWFSRLVDVAENAEILATKSVNEAAKARYGNSADGKILIRNLANFRENPAEYPHFLRPGNARTDMTGGLRSCYPYMAATGNGTSAVAWFAEMDNHFPKGVAMDRDLLSFDIWPAWAGDMRVRRGQSKEHDLYIGLFPAVLPHATLEGHYFDHEFQGYGVWGASSPPVEFTFDPAYIRETRVFDLHRYLPFNEQEYLPIEQKLNTFAHAGQPSRGMFDFGDHVTPDRSWSHNNENDAILHSVQEYMRRGAWDCLRGALANARHNAHVDFVAFDPDPLRQGTMPAHCPEHVDGAAYPSHMWVGGLLAAYLLTGNEDFREAAVSVGENMMRWQAERPEIFYTDSRECGWPMLAWIQLHDHTGEARWLKAARKVAEYYRGAVNDDGVILYDLPHGVGTYRGGYGEFIAWRALFFYYERTQDAAAKTLLLKALPRAFRRTPAQYAAGGWACNDLFPAWAAYTLSGDRGFLEQNYEFLRYLLRQPGAFAWGGVDVHYFLAELDKLGELKQFCRNS
jgi:hypothetical protein